MADGVAMRGRPSAALLGVLMPLLVLLSLFRRFGQSALGPAIIIGEAERDMRAVMAGGGGGMRRPACELAHDEQHCDHDRDRCPGASLQAAKHERVRYRLGTISQFRLMNRTKLVSAVRDLGMDADDALALCGQTAI